MEDIVPSIYNTRAIGETSEDNGAFGNLLLRVGEVKRIIYPEDRANRSKKFIEYDVYVQHRENGTAVTKIYHNCHISNELASLADYSFRTLRVAAPRKGSTSDEAVTAELGYGAKVLLHCINGEDAEAVIVGGIRDERQTDIGRKARGVHLEEQFNGVHLQINDDGSFSVERRGPTTEEGKLDTSKAGGTVEAAGTKIEVDAEGSFRVTTKDKKQSIVIDHKTGKITITGDKEMTLHAQKIKLGDGATEKAVLGDTLVGILGQLCDAITQITVVSPAGNTGPPLNAAAFKAIKAKLKSALSQFITVKKTP